jgi:hypothetical protein
MSFQVDTALVQGYKAGIEIQHQQKGSRFRPWVRMEKQSVEFDFYDRIGPVDAVEVTTRHGDTPLISTPHDRRRVALRDFDWADLIDKKDKIRMLSDPTSPYTQNAVFSLGRKMDDIIIEAAFGNAYTGKTGSTTVTFPAGKVIEENYVESGTPANSNLTVAKLRRAKTILDTAEALEDGEPLVAAVSPEQIQALLRDPLVTSADYNTVKALVNGEIDTYMGFKFIKSNRLPKSGNIRNCMFWAKSGLLLAANSEVDVDIGPRRDKRNSMQVYVCGHFSATRMWEDKVLQVQCDETA